MGLVKDLLEKLGEGVQEVHSICTHENQDDGDTLQPSLHWRASMNLSWKHAVVSECLTEFVEYQMGLASKSR